MKKIYSLAILLLAFNSYAQIKNNKTPLDDAVTSSTAFMDASSSVAWNKSTNIGKGLVFPRTDLTKLNSLAAPVNGLPASFPTRLDGMIVYNTATGTSGIGNTTVAPGFYYYKNDSKDLNGGTWVRIGTAGDNDTPFNIGKWHYVLDFAADKALNSSGSQATNGLKIKTNIPFESGKYMPLIKIQGYAFKEATPLDINLVFYIYNERFINYSATSSGGVAPKLKLANEDGKVVIFLDLKGEKSYYTRFNVQAFENLASKDIDFKGWSVVDEAVTGSSMVDVEYRTSTPHFYTQDGTLTENRTVNLDNKNLAFTGGQVGINTKEPKATFDIQANPNKTSVNDGILIPRVGTAKRNSYTNPENGLMVYNTDLNCYETNVGTPNEPEWQCLATAQKVQTLTIEPVGFIGNYRYGTINDPEEKKVLFKVTNNTNSTISGVDLSYVHVDGRTQYVERGQNDNVTILGNSSKVLEYGISGGNWTSSVFTLTYDQYSSASIRLVIDRENYLTNPDRQGTGDGGTATIGDMRKEIFLVKDNSASTPIDKTLTISADKPLKVKIPFTNGTGNYLGYTSPAVEIQDVNGKTREIQLSYVEGNLDIGKGFIEATIESRDGEDLTLPQTTLGHSLTIAQIPVRLNNKDKGTFDLIAFGGIPDKRFGDDSGHDFVYMTVTSPTGKVWLNNNLGAEYARIESEVFNPQKQAQSIDDINAFGSRYQYHRYSDGHELSSIVDGDYRENTNETQTLSKSFRPDDAIVIINPESDIYPQEDRKYNWVKEDYLNSHQTEWQNLWDGVNGANNPCPEGFRIPTRAEAQNEIDYLEQKSDMGAFNSVLKFTRQLWLDKNNKTFSANPSNAYISNNADQFTNNVRCIKN